MASTLCVELGLLAQAACDHVIHQTNGRASECLLACHSLVHRHDGCLDGACHKTLATASMRQKKTKLSSHDSPTASVLRAAAVSRPSKASLPMASQVEAV